MSDRECSISDCGGKMFGRGWCEKHYTRWRRHGDPLALTRYKTPAEALAARVESQADCLVWTGAINAGGYGLIRIDGKTRTVHRFAWEQGRGPIPEGLFVDHICWNRACVNLTHLRIVSRQQNNSYLNGAQQGRALPRNVSKYRNRYTVRVRKNGRQHYFGSYASPQKAALVAATKREELFGAHAGR